MDKDFVIKKLTELWLEQEFTDRAKGKETYVKKTRIYKDLIEFFKEQL